MNNSYFFISKLLTPLLIPINFLFILSFFLIFIYFKSKNNFILKLFILNIFIILSIGFLPLGKVGLKYLEKDFIVQKNYKDIKNIIVLSGADTRITASIKLAKIYDNSKIYYIGVNPYYDKKNPLSEHKRAKYIYQNMNFDVKRIIFIGKSKNTIENFDEIEMLNLDENKTILITSAYHMKRSMMIAKKKNLNFLPFAIDFTQESYGSFINSYRAFDIVANLNNFNLFFREVFGITIFKIFF